MRAPQWTYCELESKELLSICLRKIKGLKTVKLIEVGFIWTEPHSKRLKVKCTVSKEVVKNVNVQSSFITEFVVHY